MQPQRRGRLDSLLTTGRRRYNSIQQRHRTPQTNGRLLLCHGHRTQRQRSLTISRSSVHRRVVAASVRQPSRSSSSGYYWGRRTVILPPIKTEVCLNTARPSAYLACKPFAFSKEPLRKNSTFIHKIYIWITG